MSKTKLTKADVKHLATLAGITLEPKEEENYKNKLTETLDYIENLNELDITDIEPSSSPIKHENVYFQDGEMNKRGLKTEESLKNSKKRSKDYFSVKKIL